MVFKQFFKFVQQNSWISIIVKIVFFPIVLTQIKKDRVPLVSIVIPCYNQGHFLQETLSNLEPNNSLYEVIIINDGSTSNDSSAHFETISKLGYRVVHQENAGLSAARNAGIALGSGKYVLLLDADNKIELAFLAEAVNVLEKNDNVAVVYGDAQYFGTKSGMWEVGNFNLQKLMLSNYIDACAIVRKSVFEELGGYDTNILMRAGWEDWEMWLRIAFNGKVFHYIPRLSFHYRVADKSMVTKLAGSYETRNNLIDYLHSKFPGKLGHLEVMEYVSRRFKPHPFKFIIKISLFSWFRNSYNSLAKKNKIVNSV